MRRQCQEILPNLLLGPFLVSKSKETLKELGITHMCRTVPYRLCIDCNLTVVLDYVYEI